MRAIAICVAVVLGSACGGDDGAGSGDDGGDNDAGPTTFPISFEILGDMPHLVAIKNDGGAWQTLPLAVNGMYSQIHVTRKHAIAMVCGAQDALFQTSIELRTTGDDPPFLFCYNYADSPTTRHAVTGTMQQAGQVFMQTSASSTTMPWNFDLSVGPGTHDFFAFGATKMLIQRDHAINAPAALGTIDVAATGADYAVTSVLVTNLDGDTTSAEASIFTGNALASYSIQGTTVHGAPASLLVAGDFQYATITASSPTTDRSSEVEVGGTVSLTMMPKLADVEFGPTGPTWIALPEDTVEVGYTTITDNKYLSVNATGSYLGATATSLDVDLDIPDYTSEWAATIGGGSFTVYDQDFNYTSVRELLTLARVQRPATLQHRLDRAVLRAGGGATAVRARR